MRLTTRMIMVLFTISCLIFGTLAFTSYLHSSKMLNTATTQQERLLGNSMAISIQNTLRTTAQVANFIAHSPSLQTFLTNVAKKSAQAPIPTMPANLKSLLDLKGMTGSIAIYSASGAPLYAPEKTLPQSAIQSILPRAMAKEIHWFGPFKNETTKALSYVYALPLYTSERGPASLLLFILDLQESLLQITSLYEDFATLHTRLINSSGEVLVSSGDVHLMDQIPLKMRVQLFSQYAYSTRHTINGNDYNIILQRIPTTDWAVMLTIPQKTAVESSMNTIIYSLLILLIGSLILTCYCARLLKTHRAEWQEALEKLYTNKKLPQQTLTFSEVNNAESLYQLFSITLTILQKTARQKPQTLYQAAQTQAYGTAQSPLPSIVQNAKNMLQSPETLQNELEEQLRYILDSSPTGVFVSHSGFVTFTNPALRSMIALGNDKNLLPAFVNPEDFADIMRQVHEEHYAPRREVHMRAPCGLNKILLISCTAATIDNRPCIIGWLTDITDMKEAESEIIQAKDLAENAIQTKTIFLANMSHEIRTPMNAIMGMNHLLMQTTLSDKQQNYTQKIDAAVKALLRIVNDILDFSKIEEGQFTIDHSIFNFNEMLAGVFESYKIPTGIVFEKILDDTVPQYIQGDATRLKQIITNLLDNAFKFTERGSITVHVSAKQQANLTMLLTLVITDTGIGIEQDQIEKLFQSFTQADTSTTRRYGGTGLGLAISQQLAHLMRGDISLTSTLGAGSVFTLTVPVTIPHKEELSHHQSTNSPSNTNNLRILIYEAKPKEGEVRKISVKDIFKTLGINTNTLHTPEAFINHVRQLAATDNYDALFMDWNLSQKGTLSLIKALTNLSLHIQIPPIILILDKEKQQSELQSLQNLNIAHILETPITPSHILNSLIASIGNARWLNLTEQVDYKHKATRPVRILLAEDNLINQQVTTELLEVLGLQVFIANNGQEALDMALADPYELIFMDIQMPIMDGITAVKEIRSHPHLQDIPIIAMTAHAQASDRKSSLEAGMNDHLVKPLDPQGLTASLRYWLAPDTFIKQQEKAPEPESEAAVIEKPKELADFCTRSGLNDLEGIDCKHALARMMNNEGLYSRLLMRFKAENEAIIVKIQGHLPTEPHEAQTIAHTLKSTAGNLGITNIEKASGTLEMLLKGRQEAPEAPLTKKTMQALQSPIENLDARIQSYFTAFQAIEATIEAIANPVAVAQAGTEKPSEKTLSPDELETFAKLVKEAKEKLSISDTSVAEIFEQLGPLIGAQHASFISHINQAMDLYDFDKALEVLNKLETLITGSQA